MWVVRIPLYTTNRPTTLSCYPLHYVSRWVEIDDSNVVLTTAFNSYCHSSLNTLRLRKQWRSILVITLPNLLILSLLKRGWNVQQKRKKYFHHTLNLLLHYLGKCKRSKMTQIVQKLRQSLTMSKFHTCSLIDIATEFAKIQHNPFWGTVYKGYHDQ